MHYQVRADTIVVRMLLLHNCYFIVKVHKNKIQKKMQLYLTVATNQPTFYYRCQQQYAVSHGKYQNANMFYDNKQCILNLSLSNKLYRFWFVCFSFVCKVCGSCTRCKKKRIFARKMVTVSRCATITELVKMSRFQSAIAHKFQNRKSKATEAGRQNQTDNAR